VGVEGGGLGVAVGVRLAPRLFPAPSVCEQVGVPLEATVIEDVPVMEDVPETEIVLVLDGVPVEESVPELLAVLLGEEPGERVDVGV